MKQKNKISQVINNIIWSNEALQAKADAGKQWRDKKRKPHTQDFKDEISQKMIEWHKNNTHPMQDKNNTNEAKLKISEANKGKVRSLESVDAGAKKRRMDPEREQAIIRAYQDGKNISDIEIEFNTGRSSIYRLIKRNNIHLLNNFNKWEGKTHSEETKIKISNSVTQVWMNKNDN